MRKVVVRRLALCALTVVACAPVATAGAAGDGNPVVAAGGPSAVAAPTLTPGPVTWAQVAARLRERARTATTTAAGPGVTSSPEAASASTPAVTSAATATLTVTPSTDLVAGQQVLVGGSGFMAAQFVLAECAAGGSEPSQCDLNGAQLLSPGSNGTFTSTMTVRRTLRLSSGRVDCASAPGTCEIVAIEFTTFDTAVARSPLSFDPTVPLPTPSIVVTPSTGLLAGNVVTVTGTGFTPGDPIEVAQCAAAEPFCFAAGSSGPVTVGADGRFTTQRSVGLRVFTLLGGLTNCVAVDCVIQAASFTNPDYLATAPIAFDPNQPLPPDPVITVAPRTGLIHDQTVTVTGAGFDGGSVELSECANPGGGDCSEFIGEVEVDNSGAFTTTARVSRLVTSFDPTGESSTVVDCAVAACTVHADGFGVESSFALSADASIEFDASVPPPAVPLVTVTPNTNLPYRAQLTVHGTGYRPGQFVSALYCAESPSVGGCGFSGASGVADASGTVDFTVGVKRRVASFDPERPPVDCLDADVRCFVSVQSERSYEQTQFALSFDPNAATPPPPVVAVTPDHDLGYRQSVTVTGTGFTPGFVPVQQCTSVDFGGGSFFSLCDGFTELQADAGGAVSGTVAVSRILEGGPTPIDCATTPTPCTLQVGSGDPDETASVPLQFDPSSQPPPPPALTVTPHAHLFDGEHVTVAGQHFTAGTQVGITECRAGATAIADSCDISRVRVATVGADGTFSLRFVTAAVLGTASGPVDCTASPTACVITAANAPTARDFAASPLSFDSPALELHDVTVTEGTGGMTMASVPVELSEPSRNPLTVHWVAEPGSATEGTDYMSMRGTLTIPAGVTEAMIDTDVVADRSDEPTEHFTVRVVDALGSHVADGTGTVTIRDDDAAPSVTVHDARRREDHGEAHAEVTLSAPSGKAVIVHYATHHVTARAGSDYVRKDSRLIFRPGETRHLVRVLLVNDRVHESTETFHVEIDRVEEATAARNVATVTITDDD